MYNPAFKYKKTTQSTNTMAYNCVQYTYALDDGGSTGGNAGDTLYVYSYIDYDPLGLPLAGRSSVKDGSCPTPIYIATSLI